MSAILLHGVEDGFGLEASSLESGSGDMALLGVRCDPEYRALSIIVPVWCIQAAGVVSIVSIVSGVM